MRLDTQFKVIVAIAYDTEVPGFKILSIAIL